MELVRFQELLNKHLGSMLDERGWILYTGLDALRPAALYVLGFNPASDPANLVLRDIDHREESWSAYKDQCWRCDGNGCTRPQKKFGEACLKRHQKNVLALMQGLGSRPHDCFATNAIFVESRKAHELEDLERRWATCWPLHQEMLAIVRPKLILSLGIGEAYSAFALLRRKAQRKHEYSYVGRDLKAFDGEFDLGADRRALRASVVGVYHPSWRKPPLDALKKHIAGRGIELHSEA